MRNKTDDFREEGCGVDKYLLYHDLLESLAHDQCPVCRLTEKRIDRLIKVLLREGAGDSLTIQKYVQAKGYCNAHAWKVKEAGDPASQSAFYRALLEQHRAALERYLERRRSLAASGLAARIRFSRFRGLLHSVDAALRRREEAERQRYLDSFASEARCPLCVAAEANERMYVSVIPDYFEEDEEFRERYRNRGMLCHPHMRMLVEDHARKPAVEELLTIQLTRLNLQIEHLRELERTPNVRYSEEEGGAYLGGWIRAVRLDVGLPGTDTRYKQRVLPFKSASLKP